MNNMWGNLWVISYDDVTQAEAARAEIIHLQNTRFAEVSDLALVVRSLDGTISIHRDHLSSGLVVGSSGVLGFLVGLLFTQPLLGAAIGTAVGAAGMAARTNMGFEDSFIQEVGEIITPGKCALFLLASMSYSDVLLHHIKGLGGRVLKTNVDLDWAKKVQEALDSEKS